MSDGDTRPVAMGTRERKRRQKWLSYEMRKFGRQRIRCIGVLGRQLDQIKAKNGEWVGILVGELRASRNGGPAAKI